MKKLIFLIFLIIILLPVKTNALVSGLYEPGDSLKGVAKIGYNYVGSGYYTFASGSTDLSDFILDTGFKPDYSFTSQSGTRLFYFTLDLCINGSLPGFYITSVYENYVDYIYPLGTYQYVANGDWARTNCYRAFIRLNLNYNMNVGTQGNDFLELSNNNNWFNVNASYGYNSILRYEDMVYYLEDEYNKLLTDARNLGGSTTIIDQNNTIINNQNNIDNTVGNISQDINNSTVSDPNNDISSFNQYLATNSTISSLILLPVTLYQKILNSVNANCTSYDAGEFLGSHLVFPCINISNYIGNTLWSVIDVLISGIFVYNISRHFIKVFDSMSSMKDGDIIDD